VCGMEREWRRGAWRWSGDRGGYVWYGEGEA
jgi:hypothetical protein